MKEVGHIKKSRTSNGLLYWLLALALAALLTRCTKMKPDNDYDLYQCVIDRYNIDTTILERRTIWWSNEGYVLEPNEVVKCMNGLDNWGRDCVANKIDHTYYTKNGKKIQPSVYPKKSKL